MKNSRKGFTLLEILLATGIFMVVMVVGIAIFTTTTTSSSTSEQSRINAQNARLAFESMTREVRLSRGLLYTTPEISSHMVIPPFEVAGTGDSTEIRMYQVKKATADESGTNLYTVQRKRYYRTTEGRFEVATSQARRVLPDNSTDPQFTAEQLYQLTTSNAFDPGPQNLSWGQETIGQLLSKQLSLDSLRVVRSYLYPGSAEAISGLTAQPFVQLDITIFNAAYNANKDDNQKIKTTLRTMIVPRDFVSPYEVVQQGVQGASN